MAKFKSIIPLAIALSGFGALASSGFLPSSEVAMAANPERVPDFELTPSGGGKSVHLSDFKGKVLLINFWATWCPPCRAEIPHFISLYKELKGKGVEIIGISVDSNGDQAVAPFIKEHEMNYPVLLANDKVVKDFGGIRGIPTTFIVDRKGQIVKKFVGLPSQTEEGVKDAFMQVLKPLL